MKTIPVVLPDDLANDLAEAGLLDPSALEDTLRARLREVHRGYLADPLAKAAADPEPPMTNEEINAEIAAVRAEMRRAAGL